MEQPVPDISEQDVQRLIERDFSLSEHAAVEQMLYTYKAETLKGMNRIAVCILKLANGDLESVREYVTIANNDYRDVIALAEYPNYSRHAFDELQEEEKEQLINEDWWQYKAWLNR